MVVIDACTPWLPQDQIYLKKDLADPLAHLQQAARKIAQVQAECKLPVDEDQYTDSFRPGLMDVVHAWSKVPSQLLAEKAACTVPCLA